MSHSSKKTILYVTFGEILNAPLLRRQIIELLAEIKSIDSSVSFNVIAVLPLHTFINHWRDNREAKRLLCSHGIRLSVLPTLVPSPLPNVGLMKTDKGYRPDMRWTKLASYFLGLSMLPVFAYFRYFKNVRIMHCRSYPASYAALFASKFFKDIKIIFDPRSDFPEENVTSGNWKSTDKNYLFWKKAESQLLKDSSVVACVTPDQFGVGGKINSNLIQTPNNVDCDRFKRDPEIRKKLRNDLGLSSKDIVFCYLGDITQSDWHRADIYAGFYKALREQGDCFKVLFLVPEVGANLLREQIHKIDVDESGACIISPDYDEVPNYLSAADYGIMFLHRRKNVVGTKIGEYMAASLPVLVNENCLGAASLIRKNDLGQVISIGAGDLDMNADINQMCDVISKIELEDWGKAISGFANRYFDNKVVAEQYLTQYLRLADEQ